MPNRNYQRGVRFERQLVNELKALGCVASRTAGSHGKFDVVAVATDMTTACKVNKLFDWTSQTPKDTWFDWSVRFDRGRLERVCYVKVVRDCDQWVYLIQAKVRCDK